MMTVWPLSPQRVFCVIDREYRNIEVADDALRGRFSIQGITLDLGIEPDWIGAPLPADGEWRIEWSKFYYGLDLAWAHRRTGEPRYLETWERLVQSWIACVPACFDTSDVIGRRVQNWIYAWMRFNARGSGVSAATGTRILESLEAQVSHLRAHLTPERNHRTLELYALFIAALALPELDPDGATRRFAVRELSQNLADDFLPDGVHREASTHYHLLVLRTFLGVLENARRFAIPLPPAYRERLERACEFAVHCHRPDGQIPALSDSDTAGYTELLRLAARLFHRPDWLYVATRGRRGTPPRRTAASFDAGGYYIQRSGWGGGATRFEDERYLIFDCGPLGDGGHGHYDMLNVELAAGGKPLVVDPGRYTYHADEAASPSRRWFKGTAAHNTVTVDGLDQVPYRQGRPKKPLPRATLLGRFQSGALDLLWGEAVSPCYDAVHQRRILFVAGEYWIIEDRLIGARPHRYDLRFHLTPDASCRAVVYGGARPAVWAPGLALVFGAPHEVALEHGWVSPSYGIKQPAPIVVVTEKETCEARFITLVAPLAAGAPLPRMRVRTDEQAPVTVIEIEGLGRRARDVVAWTTGGDDRPLEIAADAGRAAVVRTLPDGTCVTWRLDGDDAVMPMEEVVARAQETTR